MDLKSLQDAVLFYTKEGDCFDNFSAFAVLWNGRLWPTVEHAYQAFKFTDPEVIDLVFRATSPYEAKEIGNDPRYDYAKRDDWSDEVKLAVMEDILRAKMAQHERVRRKLRESRGRLLIEDSSTDGFWGRGPDWNGLNYQGRLWMKLRDELLEHEAMTVGQSD